MQDVSHGSQAITCPNGSNGNPRQSQGYETFEYRWVTGKRKLAKARCPPRMASMREFELKTDDLKVKYGVLGDGKTQLKLNPFTVGISPSQHDLGVDSTIIAPTFFWVTQKNYISQYPLFCSITGSGELIQSAQETTRIRGPNIRVKLRGELDPKQSVNPHVPVPEMPQLPETLQRTRMRQMDPAQIDPGTLHRLAGAMHHIEALIQEENAPEAAVEASSTMVSSGDATTTPFDLLLEKALSLSADQSKNVVDRMSSQEATTAAMLLQAYHSQWDATPAQKKPLPTALKTWEALLCDKMSALTILHPKQRQKGVVWPAEGITMKLSVDPEFTSPIYFPDPAERAWVQRKVLEEARRTTCAKMMAYGGAGIVGLSVHASGSSPLRLTGGTILSGQGGLQLAVTDCETAAGAEIVSGGALTLEVQNQIQSSGHTQFVSQEEMLLRAKEGIHLTAATLSTGQGHELNLSSDQAIVLASYLKTDYEIKEWAAAAQHTQTQSVAGCQLQAGGKLNIQTNQNLDSTGSKVHAKEGINVDAKGGIALKSRSARTTVIRQDTVTKNTWRHSLGDLMQANHLSEWINTPVSLHVGSQTETTCSITERTKQTGETWESEQGNLSFSSDQTVCLQGVQASALSGDVELNASEVQLLAAEESERKLERKIKQGFEFTFSASLGVGSSVKTAQAHLEGIAGKDLPHGLNTTSLSSVEAASSIEAGDALSQAGALAAASLACASVFNSSKVALEKFQNLTQINLDASFSMSRTETQTDQRTVSQKGCQISGQNLRIYANNKVTSVGSTLQAADKLEVKAKTLISQGATTHTTATTQSRDQSQTFSAQVNVGLIGSSGEVQKNLHLGTQEMECASTSHIPSLVQANTVHIQTEADCVLKDTMVQGNEVEAAVNGNFFIASSLDTEKLKHHQTSHDLSVSGKVSKMAPFPTPAAVSLHQGSQNVEANCQHIASLSGIDAKTRYQVTVKGMTHLEGGMVRTDGDTAQSCLQTDKLNLKALTESSTLNTTQFDVGGSYDLRHLKQALPGKMNEEASSCGKDLYHGFSASDSAALQAKKTVKQRVDSVVSTPILDTQGNTMSGREGLRVGATVADLKKRKQLKLLWGEQEQKRFQARYATVKRLNKATKEFIDTAHKKIEALKKTLESIDLEAICLKENDPERLALDKRRSIVQAQLETQDRWFGHTGYFTCALEVGQSVLSGNLSASAATQCAHMCSYAAQQLATRKVKQWVVSGRGFKEGSAGHFMAQAAVGLLFESMRQTTSRCLDGVAPSPWALAGSAAGPMIGEWLAYHLPNSGDSMAAQRQKIALLGNFLTLCGNGLSPECALSLRRNADIALKHNSLFVVAGIALSALFIYHFRDSKTGRVVAIYLSRAGGMLVCIAVDGGVEVARGACIALMAASLVSNPAAQVFLTTLMANGISAFCITGVVDSKQGCKLRQKLLDCVGRIYAHPILDPNYVEHLKTADPDLYDWAQRALAIEEMFSAHYQGKTWMEGFLDCFSAKAGLYGAISQKTGVILDKLGTKWLENPCVALWAKSTQAQLGKALSKLAWEVAKSSGLSLPPQALDYVIDQYLHNSDFQQRILEEAQKAVRFKANYKNYLISKGCFGAYQAGAMSYKNFKETANPFLVALTLAVAAECVKPIAIKLIDGVDHLQSKYWNRGPKITKGTAQETRGSGHDTEASKAMVEECAPLVENKILTDQTERIQTQDVIPSKKTEMPAQECAIKGPLENSKAPIAQETAQEPHTQQQAQKFVQPGQNQETIVQAKIDATTAQQKAQDAQAQQQAEKLVPLGQNQETIVQTKIDATTAQQKAQDAQAQQQAEKLVPLGQNQEIIVQAQVDTATEQQKVQDAQVQQQAEELVPLGQNQETIVQTKIDATTAQQKAQDAQAQQQAEKLVQPGQNQEIIVQAQVDTATEQQKVQDAQVQQQAQELVPPGQNQQTIIQAKIDATTAQQKAQDAQAQQKAEKLVQPGQNQETILQAKIDATTAQQKAQEAQAQQQAEKLVQPGQNQETIVQAKIDATTAQQKAQDAQAQQQAQELIQEVQNQDTILPG